MVEFINSDDFKAELEKSGGVHTPKFSSEIFEQCFKRSYNVEFIMKTNLKELRRAIRDGCEKPIIAILVPQSQFKPELIRAI